MILEVAPLCANFNCAAGGMDSRVNAKENQIPENRNTDDHKKLFTQSFIKSYIYFQSESIMHR